jgi:drug/metabolite transporter superfamily protein YnfA
MSTSNQNCDHKNKGIYRAGAIAAILVIAGSLLDIIVGTISGGDLSALPQSAVERFAQFNQSPWLGLYHLDFLNVCNQLLFIPAFYALYLLLGGQNKRVAQLALLIFITGTAVFAANNTALPMLDLSHKYSLAVDDARRSCLAGAGEALIARGAHGSPGVFFSFILIILSEILISLAMLRSKIFKKGTALLGIIGPLMLAIYIVLVTFVPSVKTMAVIFATPGGLLTMVWIIIIAGKLLKQPKNSSLIF